MMALNRGPRPEGSQVNKSKDSRLSGKSCSNQCVCSLILGNWVSTISEAFIQVQQEVFAIAQTPPCSADRLSRAMWVSKTILANDLARIIAELKLRWLQSKLTLLISGRGS